MKKKQVFNLNKKEQEKILLDILPIFQSTAKLTADDYCKSSTISVIIRTYAPLKVRYVRATLGELNALLSYIYKFDSLLEEQPKARKVKEGRYYNICEAEKEITFTSIDIMFQYNIIIIEFSFYGDIMKTKIVEFHI